MKFFKAACVFFLLFGLISSSAAWAQHRHFHHHRHAHAGVFVTVPWFWYSSPQPYYYSYPPAVALQPSPPVYIERSDVPQSQSQPQGSSQGSNYWYYCDRPEGYYPYIKECPAGWRQVPARPPDLQR